MVLKDSFDDDFVYFITAAIVFVIAIIIAGSRSYEIEKHNKDINVANTKAKVAILEQIILDDLGEQRKAYTIQKHNAYQYNIIPMVFKEQ